MFSRKWEGIELGLSRNIPHPFAEPVPVAGFASVHGEAHGAAQQRTFRQLAEATSRFQLWASREQYFFRCRVDLADSPDRRAVDLVGHGIPPRLDVGSAHVPSLADEACGSLPINDLKPT